MAAVSYLWELRPTVSSADVPDVRVCLQSEDLETRSNATWCDPVDFMSRKDATLAEPERALEFGQTGIVKCRHWLDY